MALTADLFRGAYPNWPHPEPDPHAECCLPLPQEQALRDLCASRHVQAVTPEAYSTESGGLLTTVTYELRRFGFHSGDSAVMLWIGCSEPGEPDAEVLADLLLSDAAKAARCDQ